MVASIAITALGFTAVALAVMSFRLPVLRAPGWPHVAVTLLCMGTVLAAAPAAVSLPDRGAMGGVWTALMLIIASLFVLGLVSLVWIPRRLREALPSWDPDGSQPWIRRRRNRSEP